MAQRKPKIGDPVVYRGRYREVVGWQKDGTVGSDRTDVIAYQNPETERNTYSREADLRWSDYLGAWYPVGLILSREEAVLYATLPGTIGNGVPQATAHESAVRLLDAEDLDQELDEAAMKRFTRTAASYWPKRDKDGNLVPHPKWEGFTQPAKTLAEVVEVAQALRAHREEARNG